MHPAAKSVRALRSGWLVRRGALGNDHATTQSLGSDDRPSLATDIWTTALLTRTRRELATPVRLSGHKDTDGLATLKWLVYRTKVVLQGGGGER
jgi:hypothetical protein